MNDLLSGAINIDDMAHTIAPIFSNMFSSLLDVMSTKEKKKRPHHATQSISLAPESSESSESSKSSSASLKRPTQSQTSSVSKRTKQTVDPASPFSDPKTPDQPTHPVDPTFSGDTDESTDEENTKMLLKLFVLSSMSVLGEDIRSIRWQNSGFKVVNTLFPNLHAKKLIKFGNGIPQSLNWGWKRSQQSMMVG